MTHLHRAGQNIVVVTHDAEIAARTARRVAFHDGTIVADEPTGRALAGAGTAGAPAARDRRSAT